MYILFIVNKQRIIMLDDYLFINQNLDLVLFQNIFYIYQMNL